MHGAGGIGGLLLWNKPTGTFLYLYDANGNVGQLVNASSGSIAARYEYDPFGKTLVADGPEAANNPYRFSTKYFDAEAGLYHYGYRYYSPTLGRWTTRDPIEEEGGLNLYGFVRNNPTNRIDFLGQFSEYIDCCPCQKVALMNDHVKALHQLLHLRDSISAAITERSQDRNADNGEFTDMIARDLEDALRVSKLAINKLSNCKVKCINKDSDRYAMAIPFGNTIRIYGEFSMYSYWNLTDTIQAAILVHELTHLAAATTDAAYFWQEGRGIKNTFFARYTWIASTYDTWIVTGFCIPGVDCPATVKVNPFRIGGKECP